MDEAHKPTDGDDVPPAMLALVPPAVRVAWDIACARGHERSTGPWRESRDLYWGAVWDSLYQPGCGVIAMLALSDVEQEIGLRCINDPALQAEILAILGHKPA